VHVDTFIALSEFSRDKHREFGFPHPMEVLPPLVSDGAVARGDDEPPLATPYFLCVGRLEEIKGIHTVIPLFVADPPADLVIAGAGSQEPELRRLANGSPHIHFVGQRAPDALRRYYRHARAHIAASICFETFGNTVVESLQQAAPVIARRIGPFPELIEGSGGGALFSDVAELRSAVERLAADDDLRARMGAAGTRTFEARWSERAVLPRYLDIVDRARASRHAPAALTPVAS
jgi:glycosyltransferase involved in cell wall biosynthesis